MALMLTRLKQILFIVLIALTLANPVLALAQSQSPGLVNPINPQVQTTNVDVPVYQNVQQSVTNFLCTPSENPDGRDLERCINKVYRFGIAFGAIALVFFVVLAGYYYITGGENGKGKAKGIVQNSLVGMGLLLGSYVLLRFINPDLVVFKPIQPPIFSAEDLPSCDEIGLGNDCVIVASTEEQTDGNTGTGGGSYADCSGGVIPISGIPRAGSGTRICKELSDKMVPLLAQFKSQAPGYYFAISSTIRNTRAESRCHYDGNSKSGNCADTVLRTTAGAKVPGSNPAWGTLCRLLLGAGLSLANETGSAHQGCRNPTSYQFTNGAHFHVYVPGR